MSTRQGERPQAGAALQSPVCGICYGSCKRPQSGAPGLSQHPPVFPDVGSMMVSPGFRVPARSASSIMRRLMRSFTLPPALKNSHLATGAETSHETGRARTPTGSLLPLLPLPPLPDPPRCRARPRLGWLCTWALSPRPPPKLAVLLRLHRTTWQLLGSETEAPQGAPSSTVPAAACRADRGLAHRLPGRHMATTEALHRPPCREHAVLTAAASALPAPQGSALLAPKNTK